MEKVLQKKKNKKRSGRSDKRWDRQRCEMFNT